MVPASILIVEDEAVIADYLQELLEGLGYRVPGIVSSGEEAVSETARILPDLVLMDIVLEGEMDGVEAARQILDTSGVPVIYLTAYADQGLLERVKATEPSAYLLKPFNERELYATIEVVLHKHRRECKSKELEHAISDALGGPGDAVFGVDAAGCVIYMNHAAEILTGWSNRDVLGKRLKDVLGMTDDGNPVCSEDSSAWTLREVAPLTERDGSEAAGAVLVFRDTAELQLAWDLTRKTRCEINARLNVKGTESTGAEFEDLMSDCERTEDRIRTSLREKESILAQVYRSISKDETISHLLPIREGEPIKDKEAISMLQECRNRMEGVAPFSGENRKPEMHRVIGSSRSFLRILLTIDEIKDSASNVLITGETGTGKEVVARMLHRGSYRTERPFVTVDCSAMPRELIEVELFGCEKGAFTGATSQRTGKFEEVAGGTLFLDEIGELPLDMQSKLLRVLQEREIERLGSNRRMKVEFRLLSSSSRDLSAEVEAGCFREDLFYRINAINIHVPPLRDRKEDIPLLVAHFVRDFSKRENKALSVHPEVVEILLSHSWPGNIRELKNIIERAAVLAKGGSITSKELPADLLSLARPHGKMIRDLIPLKEMEIKAIRDCLLVCGGNKSKVARLLGISRKVLYSRLREFGLMHTGS